MNPTDVLSELQFLDKYARFSYENGRRENWKETVDRVVEYLASKVPIEHRDEFYNIVYPAVFSKRVTPSMRLMASAGKAADLNNASIYNCFGRETKFVTEFGVKSFFDFEDGDEIVVKTHDGSWKNAIVKNFGKQKLNKITFGRLRSTKEIRATSNHEWILGNGNRTNSLKVGDIIYGVPDEIFDWDFDNATPIEKIAWCYGYVYGDGTVNNKHSMVRLCGEQSKYLNRFLSCDFGSSQSMSLNGDYIVYTGSYLKTTPEISLENIDEIRAFVVGYLDADAAKSHSGSNKNKYLSIQSSQDDHIDFIESAFEMVGVYILNSRDLTGQETNFGTRPNTFFYGLTHNIDKTNTRWSVRSIVEDVGEDVWCLVVEDNHSFILSGGIVTGNCSYLPIESVQDFHDITLLLGLGVGVGFSVEKKYVEKLGYVKPFKGTNVKFVVPDDIYGWAQSISFLIENKIAGNKVNFDYSLIRPAGSPLKTRGGRASGPDPLMDAHRAIGNILFERSGKEIRTIDAFDIACHIAGAIVSGGVRRSAMITLFDNDDDLMLSAKSGENFSKNLQRQYANVSAIVDGKLTKKQMDNIIQRMHDSGFGEPGIFSRYAVKNTLPERRKYIEDFGTNP